MLHNCFILYQKILDSSNGFDQGRAPFPDFKKEQSNQEHLDDFAECLNFCCFKSAGSRGFSEARGEAGSIFRDSMDTY
jgi:hypothetical protein